jgi:hypothetical protein
MDDIEEQELERKRQRRSKRMAILNTRSSKPQQGGNARSSTVGGRFKNPKAKKASKGWNILMKKKTSKKSLALTLGGGRTIRRRQVQNLTNEQGQMMGIKGKGKNRTIFESKGVIS